MNLQEDKWFIRVPDEEQAKAVQEWLFKEGLGWAGKKTLRDDYETWSSEKSIGCGHFGGKSLGQAGAKWWIDQGHKEILVTFKTAIDTVKYPEVLSPHEIKIRELEETIAKAHEQIQALKKEI